MEMCCVSSLYFVGHLGRNKRYSIYLRTAFHTVWNPQAGLARIERGRRQQGLVHDFKIQGAGGEGDLLCKISSEYKKWDQGC